MRFGFAIGDTGIREQVQCFDLRTDYILALFDDDLDFVAAAHIVRARDDDLAEFAFSVDPDSWGLMNAGIRRHRQLRLIEGDSDDCQIAHWGIPGNGVELDDPYPDTPTAFWSSGISRNGWTDDGIKKRF